MRLINTAIVAAIFPSLSFAFFCPTNFNQINIGDTLAQVQQQCGKPDKEEKSQQDPMTPQEWTYYITQTILTNKPQQAQGTMRTSIAFDKDGKVISINANGVGVGESTVCGAPIRLGQTMEMIKKACGEPNYINKQQASGAISEPPTLIIVYTYNSTPPQKLTFENGKLARTE